MTAPGDHRFQRQLRGGPLALLLVGAVAVISLPPVGSGELATQRAGTRQASSSSDGIRSAHGSPVRSTLRHQLQALQLHSRSRYVATWGHASAGRAGEVFANLRRLHAVVTSIRLVPAHSTSGPACQHHPGNRRAWSTRVQVGWRLRTHMRLPASSVVRYTFACRGRATVVTDIRAARRQPQPVWLLPKLHVNRSARILSVAASSQQARRLHSLLSGAARNVKAVIPRWHGTLVVVDPASFRQFQSLLGRGDTRYSGVAGVAATLGGRTDASAPAIYVNPRQFRRLSPLGASVVMTHEATHAATGATTATAPLWVVEGFADYVALRSRSVPLSTPAARMISDLRRHGVPAALPSNADFRSSGAEVAYEQAWLAARLIAAQYGESTLVAFYRRVLAAGSVNPALRTVLHTSGSRFTQQWRQQLKSTARAG